MFVAAGTRRWCEQMAKRTSKKREKLPPLIERYLQLLEQKIPTLLWKEVLASNVVFSNFRGRHVDGYQSIAQQIERWHRVMTRVSIQMIRMVDYPPEDSIDRTGRQLVKVDFVVKALWLNGVDPVGIVVQHFVIAMYHIRDGKIEEINEAWPVGKIPPTVG